MRARRLSLAAVAVILIAGIGRLAMPCVGQALVVNDRLQKADAIVVLSSPRIDRTYEAALLWKERWAPVVVISVGNNTRERELADRYHVKVPQYADTQRSVFEQVGTPPGAILTLPGAALTTRDEADLLAHLAAERRWTRVIVCTSDYHTRRARMIFRDAAEGRYEVLVRRTRFEQIDPAEWWRSRSDRRAVLLEYLKFVAAWRSWA
jgi:uncharacterized SAM-binding protein YcdF (DUF218 family)